MDYHKECSLLTILYTLRACALPCYLSNEEKKSLVVLALVFLPGEATYARTQETLVSEKAAQVLILTELQESGNDAIKR